MDLPARPEQQASSLEETAVSMEALTSTVVQIADHVRHANPLDVKASTTAAKRGEVVIQVIRTMRSINDSSRKVVVTWRWCWCCGQ